MDREKKIAQTSVEAERTRLRKVYVPRVDIYESKDAIVIIADMPGIDAKSADITLENNILTISGTVQDSPYERHSVAYAEYKVGDYERSFTISDEVDRDAIEAKVKNGVLNITLHKAAPVKAKKIGIKAA